MPFLFMPFNLIVVILVAKENGGDESDEYQGHNNEDNDGANDGVTGRRIAAVATVDAVAVGTALSLVVAAVGARRTTGAAAGSVQTFS